MNVRFGKIKGDKNMTGKLIERAEFQQKAFEYLYKLIPVEDPYYTNMKYIETTIANDYEMYDNMEFPDPAAVTYITENDWDIVEIEGVEYIRRRCYINLEALYFTWMENGFGTVIDISQLISKEQPKFQYFKYYRKDDLTDNSVSTLVKSRQLFEIIE